MHPLIHDWNGGPATPAAARDSGRRDPRDGLQSPSVRCPTIDEKLRILHLIDRLGIESADIGLPGAGPHVVRDVERLAREIVDARLRVAAELRCADARRGHRADRGDLSAGRTANRVLRLHRLEPASTVRRGLERSIGCCG